MCAFGQQEDFTQLIEKKIYITPLQIKPSGKSVQLVDLNNEGRKKLGFPHYLGFMLLYLTLAR